MNYCKECGIYFIANKQHPKQQFCSKECRILNISKNNICIDCKKPLNPQAKYAHTIRCRKCNDLFKKGKQPKGGFALGETKGENNINWLGGKSFEPYSIDWTETFKEQIRKRDNYECKNCGMTEEEHLIVVGINLHVHHIDYNKKNCNENNLITLCNSCNVRANYNRNYWKEFYQNKIIIIQKEIIPNG